MSDDELLTFVVEVVTKIFETQGMDIINKNTHSGYEYLNFIMKSKKNKLYYVLLDISIFPNNKTKYQNLDLSEYINLAINLTPRQPLPQ